MLTNKRKNLREKKTEILNKSVLKIVNKKEKENESPF